MHPSTQVTHIPEDGTTEPSVLFFVNVAAEEFIRDSDIGFSFHFFLIFNGRHNTREP
jgi:hypothetical protein